MTFSIGAATCIEARQTAAEIMQRIDESMYSAKSRGKNSFEYDILKTG